MNRNWIVLVLAIVSLASCSVEKRVYQPGYHIEWNHYAAQEQFQDVSQGRSEGASQDLPQDLSENLSQNIDSDFEKILLILLALFLPALTIFLSEGFSKNFWISAILMLLAFSLPVPSFLKLLIEVLAIVLAIAVVLHYL